MLPVTVQSSTNLFALPVNGSYDPAVVMLPLYSPVGPVGLSPPIPASEEPRPSSKTRTAGKSERWKFFIKYLLLKAGWDLPADSGWGGSDRTRRASVDRTGRH